MHSPLSHLRDDITEGTRYSTVRAAALKRIVPPRERRHSSATFSLGVTDMSLWATVLHVFTTHRLEREREIRKDMSQV